MLPFKYNFLKQDTRMEMALFFSTVPVGPAYYSMEGFVKAWARLPAGSLAYTTIQPGFTVLGGRVGERWRGRMDN